MGNNRKWIKGAVFEIAGVLIGFTGFHAHQAMPVSAAVATATGAVLVLTGLVLVYKGLRLQSFSYTAFSDEEPEDDNIYKKFSRALGMLKSVLDIFV